jgi:hypothetical protein
MVLYPSANTRAAVSGKIATSTVLAICQEPVFYQNILPGIAMIASFCAAIRS